ncbi:hypothetical protein ACLOJK_038965 [Asimina triloba]
MHLKSPTMNSSYIKTSNFTLKSLRIIDHCEAHLLSMSKEYISRSKQRSSTNWNEDNGNKCECGYHLLGAIRLLVYFQKQATESNIMVTENLREKGAKDEIKQRRKSAMGTYLSWGKNRLASWKLLLSKS